MNDIDRAVEAYTRQAFREYTENRTYRPEPEPIYCGGCSDKEVANEGDVCATCRASEADDWIFPGGYEHMRELAALQDARAEVVNG